MAKNISITGCIGGGKSSICSELKRRYGYEIVTAGSLFRDFARDHHISIEEAIKGHPEIDKKIDGWIAEIGRTKEDVVFDSRMAWHFAPASFKVFLYTDEDISVSRVFGDIRDTEQFETIDDCKRSIFERQHQENENYETLYGKNYLNLKHFDLIIDSSYATPEQIADKLVECARAWENGEVFSKYQLSPRSLYPTITKEEVGTDCRKKYESGDAAIPDAAVAYDDGYWKIIKGHCAQLASLKLGNPFIGAYYDDGGDSAGEKPDGGDSGRPSERKDVPILEKNDLMNYEREMGYTYQSYPGEENRHFHFVDR